MLNLTDVWGNHLPHVSGNQGEGTPHPRVGEPGRGNQGECVWGVSRTRVPRPGGGEPGCSRQKPSETVGNRRKPSANRRRTVQIKTMTEECRGPLFFVNCDRIVTCQPSKTATHQKSRPRQLRSFCSFLFFHDCSLHFLCFHDCSLRLLHCAFFLFWHELPLWPRVVMGDHQFVLVLVVPRPQHC